MRDSLVDDLSKLPYTLEDSFINIKKALKILNEIQDMRKFSNVQLISRLRMAHGHAFQASLSMNSVWDNARFCYTADDFNDEAANRALKLVEPSGELMMIESQLSDAIGEFKTFLSEYEFESDFCKRLSTKPKNTLTEQDNQHFKRFEELSAKAPSVLKNYESSLTGDKLRELNNSILGQFEKVGGKANDFLDALIRFNYIPDIFNTPKSN